MRTASGFPYWDVFVIDLEKNDWVKGTPVRVWLEEDGAKLGQARDKARTAAAAALKASQCHRTRRCCSPPIRRPKSWPSASASPSTAGTRSWGAQRR